VGGRDTDADCADSFDVALYDIRDQWCSLFTPETVATLDYDDDLKAFYQLAGGYAINYEMASVLLQDIVAVMDQRISGASSIEGAFRFAHAETTLPLMTLLGFGDKTPLYASASRGQIHRRGFRTSALAPFGANIEFRLYAETRDKATSPYYVQVIVNERDDVEVPGCGLVFCPLETLKTSLWRRFLYEYDFAQQCRA
jgi:multiple inositol-polyphosphate phosphatase / 2,3-bisphosphoglycerate 3-phosphatase